MNHCSLHACIGETRSNNCYSNFYFEASKNYCVPDCHSWTSYSRAESQVNDAIAILASLVGMLSAITVVLISCCRGKAV